MSEIALEVRNLGKAYKINRQSGGYKTLQEELLNLVKTPFKKRASGLKQELFWALNDVTFDVKQGEVLGIIGRNGAGKSTLLKILSRITRPTTGYAEIRGRVGSLLEVGTGFHPELTGRENIFLNGAILGMTRRDIQRQFDEIVAFAEVEQFLDTPVKRYSSGMYMRLAFAVAAHLNPEILVIDEVLAVGDAEFQKKSLGKMSEVAKSGRTVLFVSHNMAAVEQLCNRAMLLRDGKVKFAGSLRETIGAYLGETNDNFVKFTNAPLKTATMSQIDDSIHLKVEYETQEPIDFPNLGFVIKDLLGNPICGSNPLLEGLVETKTPVTKGHVEVVIKQPKLLNGVYRLSLWFGNSKMDIFNAQDCLQFEIANMTKNRQLNPSSVGSVMPICEWFFS
jgi:lipopolysaccharide transport system ATP-binding protein